MDILVQLTWELKNGVYYAYVVVCGIKVERHVFFGSDPELFFKSYCTAGVSISSRLAPPAEYLPRN